jgi:hypothetical protein
MSRKIDNPARYRYERRVIKIFSFWGVFTALLVWKGRLTGILAYALAVLLSLPLVGLIVAFGLYLRDEQDEFLRNIQIQSMLWSIGATFTVTIFLGFLEFLGLTPHFNPYWIFILFMCFMGISGWLLKLRYR